MGLSLNQAGKILTWLFCVALIFLALNFSDTIEDSNYPAIGVIDYMTLNFNSAPIYDITTIPADEVCSSGYELLSLGNWSGTYQGCSRGFLGLTFGTCWIGDNIPAEPQVPLYQWNDTLFCAKKNQDYYYSQDTCESGYQSCGSILCVALNESCPITSITVADTFNPSDEYTDFEGQYLIFGNNNGNPINLLQFSAVSPAPCYAQGWTPSDSNSFKLAIQNYNGCGFAGQDNSINVLTNLSQQTLFQENNLENTMNSLPGYISSISGDLAYLVGRKKIETIPSTDCNINLYKTNEFALPLLQQLISYQDEVIDFIEIEIAISIFVLVFIIKKATKYADIFLSGLLFVDIIYFIYLSSIVKSQLNQILDFTMPYTPLYTNECFSEVVFDDAITNYNSFVDDFPSKISDRIIIIFVVLALRNLANTITIILSLRAKDAKNSGEKKSILTELYSIFCICFALTGGED